jgi:hypothetical protein
MRILGFLLLGACVADVPASQLPTADDFPPVQSEAAGQNARQTAFNYFVSKGLTKTQSAGIVGNLMQESSVIPTAVEPGGAGRGIAQWSVGGRWDSGRSDSVTGYVNSHGGSRWSLQTQLDFVWYELDSVGGYGLPELRSATTISSAVVVFQNRFEACGACSQSQRISYAQQVYNDYASSAPTGGGSGGGSGSGGDTSTGATCASGTLGRDVPDNTCVQSMYDGDWYQCSNGSWVDRWSDPDACNGEYPL